MNIKSLLTLSALASLSAPSLAATAKPSAFAPAGQGREYEYFAQWALTDPRPLGKLNLLLFAEGRPAKNHDSFAEGALANYKAHEYVNVLVKVLSNHVESRDPLVSPLEIVEPASKSHKFVRLQGGLQFKLPKHIDIETIAGKDLAGGPANTLEANIYWWPMIYTYYPLGLGYGIAQDDATHIIVNSFSAAIGVGRALGFKWFLTGSGQAYHGGALRKSEGRASGGIAASSRGGLGFKVSGGGGAHGAFADLGLFYLFRL